MAEYLYDRLLDEVMGDSCCWLPMSVVSEKLAWSPEMVLRYSTELEATGRVQRACGFIRANPHPQGAGPPRPSSNPCADLLSLMRFSAAPGQPWVPAGVIEHVVRGLWKWDSVMFNVSMDKLFRNAWADFAGMHVRAMDRNADAQIAWGMVATINIKVVQ